MARHTQVTCDNEACGYEDGVDGETNWIVVKRKKEINADLCSDGCLTAWVDQRRAAGDDEEIDAQLAFSGA